MIKGYSFWNQAKGLVIAVGLSGFLRTERLSAAEPADGGTDSISTILIEALAEAVAEADSLRARLEAIEFGRQGGEWTPDGTEGILDAGTLEALRVLDVNVDLRMVILNAGRRDGLRPGMRFALMRDGSAVAQVRVLDVRGSVSGALIETLTKRRKPTVSDRPVLVREQP